MKKEGLAHLVATWHAAGVAALVWEAAARHRARLVREVGLPLSTQPPASPSARSRPLPPNSTRRSGAFTSFHELRRHLQGRAYPDLAATITRAGAFLRELAAAADRLRSLTG